MESMPPKEVGKCKHQIAQLSRGSGYPGDPATKEWLNKSFEQVFAFPSLVRFSWATVDTFVSENNGVDMDWHDEDSKDDSQPGVSAFVIQKNTQSNHRRPRLFSRRNVRVGWRFWPLSEFIVVNTIFKTVKRKMINQKRSIRIFVSYNMVLWVMTFLRLTLFGSHSVVLLCDRAMWKGPLALMDNLRFNQFITVYTGSC